MVKYAFKNLKSQDCYVKYNVFIHTYGYYLLFYQTKIVIYSKYFMVTNKNMCLIYL